MCSEGYSASLAFTCTKCVDDRGGIAILVVAAVSVLGAAIALYRHLVSGEMDGARRGIIHRFIKRLPLQAIKIVVVVWQILTQVRRHLTIHTDIRRTTCVFLSGFKVFVVQFLAPLVLLRFLR